jgi:hypothetical protein
MPGFGSTDMSSIAIFVGLVILLMAPSVANDIRSLISTGRPSREGLGLIGAGLVGGVVGGITGGVTKGAQTAIGGYFGPVATDIWGKTGGRYLRRTRRAVAASQRASESPPIPFDDVTGQYRPGSVESKESPLGDEK